MYMEENINDLIELDEIARYLPIDDIEINDYKDRVMTTININYKNGEFQTAYFAMHLLFMTYIYSLIWQINVCNNEKYNIATIFAKPYNGKKLDFQKIESVFDFSLMSEKEIMNFLHLIDVDKSYIGILKKQVDKRDSMAHASGVYTILNIDMFNAEKNNIFRIIEKCNNDFCNNVLIYEYSKCLNNYFESDEGKKISDFVSEELISKYSLSKKQLEYIASLTLRRLDVDRKLKNLHERVRKELKQEYI